MLSHVRVLSQVTSGKGGGIREEEEEDEQEEQEQKEGREQGFAADADQVTPRQDPTWLALGSTYGGEVRRGIMSSRTRSRRRRRRREK